MWSTSQQFTAKLASRKARILRGASLITAVVMLVTGVGASSGSADEQRGGREPGLPFIECIGFPSVPCDVPTIVDDYGWLNAAQVGRAGSVRAQQWARIPLTMAASVAEFGAPPIEYDTPRAVAEQVIDLRIRAFFTSPSGSVSNYGDSAIMVVRTVAFGSLPVEVGLQFSQSRRPNGDLIPLEWVNRVYITTGPKGRPDVRSIWENTFSGNARPLTAKLNVKVVSVSIDGVAVRTDKTCETGPRASLGLAEKKWKIETPAALDIPITDYLRERLDSNEHFNGADGGSLHGSVDIPAFSGCITSTGDDISPILTAAISAPDNPVAAKVGLIACLNVSDDWRMAPNPPGVNSPYDPRAGCDTGLGGGSFKPVPDPMPLPDEDP